MQVVWILFLGPILSIFPKAWKRVLPFSADLRWGLPTAISGLVELVGGILALSHWYDVSMNTMLGNAMRLAAAGKMGRSAAPQEIGAVALIVWVSEPLTWLFAYIGLEGVVRLSAAAFTDTSVGILPLFLVDAFFFRPFRGRSRAAYASEQDNAGPPSVFKAAWRLATGAQRTALADELCFLRSESEEILEVSACRKKRGWKPSRVVIYEDSYYQLESHSIGSGPRPFEYRLRRIPTDVPTKKALLYAPPNVMVKFPG